MNAQSTLERPTDLVAFDDLSVFADDLSVFMANPLEANDRDARLDAAYDEYERLTKAGQRISPTEFAAGYPPELQNAVYVVVQADDFLQDIGTPTSPSPPRSISSGPNRARPWTDWRSAGNSVGAGLAVFIWSGIRTLTGTMC